MTEYVRQRFGGQAEGEVPDVVKFVKANGFGVGRYFIGF
jgi:hypothetical protein